MKANFIVKDLLNKLSVVSRIVNTSKVSLYKGITIVATEDDAYIIGRSVNVYAFARVGAKIDEPGAVTLLGDYLYEIVKTYDPEQVVRFENSRITSGEFINIAAIVQGEKLPYPKTDDYLPVNEILGAFNLLSWGDKFYAYDKYLIAGNNGFSQVSIKDINFEFKEPVSIPKEFISVVSRFSGSADILVTKESIRIKKDDYVILGALEELNKIPPFRGLLPESDMGTFTIPDRFEEAVKNATATSGDNAIELTFGSNKVKIHSHGPDIGDLEVTLDSQTTGNAVMYLYGSQILSALGRGITRIGKKNKTMVGIGDGLVEIVAEVVSVFR